MGPPRQRTNAPTNDRDLKIGNRLIMNENDKRIQKRVIGKTLETLARAKIIWGREFIKPRVVIETAGKSTAGRATYKENLIQINWHFLLHNEEYVINQTLPHEIAHLVSWQLWGREGAGHGAKWIEVMVKLGLEPSRCHSMNLKKLENEIEY